MGNLLGKQKIEDRKSVRKTIYRAQETYINRLVESNKDIKIDQADGDNNSVHSDREQTKRGSFWNQRMVVSKYYDEIDSKVLKVNLDKYEYPFENLVFEGGGSKGLAYCGATRVLEELGIMQKIKRFAGASAGAIAACLLAVGYNSYEIEEFFGQDLSKIFIDHKCGYFSLLPNLIRNYGWNPGTRVLNWLGNHLENATGDADITFAEVYERYGKEICVVVTNLNMMSTEYFHPKTTPDMPVRVAVRMSMSIPGLFQASTYGQHGQANTYVDGGLLCNYPINCFDGWWLSMKMEDSFLNRLQPIEDFARLFENKVRFGEYNPKTLGFMLYADNERYFFRDLLQERVGVDLPKFPKTKLASEKLKKKNMQEKVKLEHKHILHAANAFLKVLQKHNKDKDDKISKEELKNALNDTEDFPPRYAERLFGKNVTVDEAMAALDEDQDGEIYFHELIHFIERTGVSLQTRFLGYQRREIKGVVSFFDTLQDALLTNIMRTSVEERDMNRTVGINTGHIGTSDFKLEVADQEYLVQQGRRSTEAYLRYYVVQHRARVKDGFKSDFSSRNTSTSGIDDTTNTTTTTINNNIYSNNNADGELAQSVINELGEYGLDDSNNEIDFVINHTQSILTDENTYLNSQKEAVDHQMTKFSDQSNNAMNNSKTGHEKNGHIPKRNVTIINIGKK